MPTLCQVLCKFLHSIIEYYSPKFLYRGNDVFFRYVNNKLRLNGCHINEKIMSRLVSEKNNWVLEVDKLGY